MNKKAIITALLALVSMTGWAQNTVKGHAVNERGEGVEYVSIGIEEDSVGVISDAQGHLSAISSTSWHSSMPFLI